MSSNTNNPSHKGQDKDTQFRNQKLIVYEYLKTHTATASMIEAATGIKQKNICRYKRDLEEQGQLWEVVEKSCAITGFDAWYLTTDPDKAPKHPEQLELF